MKPDRPPLPESFLAHMRELLGEDFFAFTAAYEEEPWRGVRANLLKIPTVNMVHEHAVPVPWCKEGWAFREDLKLGQTLGYLAGLFYIQEPSAMSPAALLDAQPGERVLDLCAAPGGKTTQIAGAMKGRGLLVANDASPSRALALVRNLERAGVRNAVVLTEQPRRLAERFGGFFDWVLVDAPCSGEGMFRRDGDVLKAYSANKPETCAAMQADILRHSAEMVRPGGRLVYSTCTFNTTENEETVEKFIKTQKSAGVNFTIEHIKRIWPHCTENGTAGIGEGHFVAVLTREAEVEWETGNERGWRVKRKTSVEREAETTQKMRIERVSGTEWETGVKRESGIEWKTGVKRESGTKRESITDRHTIKTAPQIMPLAFIEFCRVFLLEEIKSVHPIIHGNGLFLQNTVDNNFTPLDLRGLRVARSGWHVGEILKGRFVPSQGLAMGLKREDTRFAVDLSEANAWRYLKGETLDAENNETYGTFDTFTEADKPWILVCHNSHPLGWARLVQGRLKNHLPTGWVR
jgi:16S rRNA C967 or C1407 C5-methylase (RsmB/RsmF family)/NOL1/NOP2/fmu family ribosome biogenesis protein